MSKKICFIMTDAISFNVLCRGQLEFFSEQKDLEITVVCGGSEEQIEFLKNRNIGKVVKIPFERKPSIWKDLICLFILFFFLAKNRFDLVVYSTPKALLISSVASFLAFQKKRIAVVQGRVYENYNGVKRRIFVFLDKMSFLLSSEVVFVSQSLMDVYIKERIVSEKKSFLIGSGSFNGVDLNKFRLVDKITKNKIRLDFGVPNDKFVVCIVGRMCVDKGIEDVLKVIKLNNDLNIFYLFVGGMEDDFAKSIITSLCNEKKSMYIAHTNEVQKIFQLSDLHLFLSFREGFGNVAIEAASCGVPTFAYKVTGVRDSVKNRVNGTVFDFGDVKSVASLIEKSAKNKAFSSDYSDAYVWASDNFDQRTVWKNYLQYYQSKMDE